MDVFITNLTKKCESHWLLVARRATYVVDGRFFGHFFWKVEGTVRTHVNSRVAHMWLPYMVINVLGGGELRTSENLESLENFQFLSRWWGALAVILDLMSGSHLELLKMAAT